MTQDPFYSWNAARTELLTAQHQLMAIIASHLSEPIKKQSDYIELLMIAPQHPNEQATSIGEMLAQAKFFRALYLEIETSSIDFRIPASIQFDRILLPLQAVSDENREAFFKAGIELLLQRNVVYKILMDEWTSRSPNSPIPDEARIDLWKHIHSLNGFPLDIKSWTVKELIKSSRKLRRECDVFEQKIKERMEIREAVSQAFGLKL